MDHHVAVVAYEGAQLAAVHGLLDVLETAARLDEEATGRRRLQVHHVRASALPRPRAPYAALVLPPSLGESPPVAPPAELGRWIRRRHAEGTTLCSVCVGAYLLAELGLLDDRPATTHWALGEHFAERFERVRVDTDRLIVDDGDVITAGGLMAWIDLALALIGRLLGPSVQLTTARYFLVDPGGREQRFYRTFSPSLTHGDEAVLRVQRWLQRHFAEPVSVPQMAAVAKLGERTFLRRFVRATGLKTTAYVQHLRVGRARELLETSRMSQQEVAWAVGYDDAGAFRKVFRRLLGVSPVEYRRRFHCATGS